MRLEELINLTALKEYIANVGARMAMTQARDIAAELASSEQTKQRMHSVFNVCNQLSDAELTDFRALLAIEGIFDKLTEDSKPVFCTTAYPSLELNEDTVFKA